MTWMYKHLWMTKGMQMEPMIVMISPKDLMVTKWKLKQHKKIGLKSNDLLTRVDFSWLGLIGRIIS